MVQVVHLVHFWNKKTAFHTQKAPKTTRFRIIFSAFRGVLWLKTAVFNLFFTQKRCFLMRFNPILQVI